MGLLSERLLASASLCLLSCVLVCCTTSNGSADSAAKLYSNCLPNAYYTLPRCKDHPDGYGCDCGPGFHWNTDVCMSTAVDSRLVFSQQNPVRYTLLVGKAFPKLSNFTIAFWIKVTDPSLNGTILSYKHDTNHNILYMRSGPNLAFHVWEQEFNSDISFTKNTWQHVVWSWSSLDGSWVLYIDGSYKMSGTGAVSKDIPQGGEFVLGQASRGEFKFNEHNAFVGELSHLHIWKFVLTAKEAKHVKESCSLMYCGDAVQWTEFRRGTRGAMRMRWPSGAIEQSCFTEDEIGISCNKYCSDTIGAQCNEQTVENIRWSRTPALINISVPCPRDALHGTPEDVNNTAHGLRPCFRTDENEGEWGPANIDACVSHSLRMLKYKFQKYFKAKYIEEAVLLELGQALVNHTSKHDYGNPVDVATVIDLLNMLVKTQASIIVLEVLQWTDGKETYATTLNKGLTMVEIKQFMEIVADIVNNLLDEKHEMGWNATTPSGVEGDNLMKVMETFSHVLSQSLLNLVTDRKIIDFKDAYLKSSRYEIELSVESQWIEEFKGIKFPSARDQVYGIQSKLGVIEMPASIHFESENYTDIVAFIRVASLRFRGMASMLPNHDVRGSGKKAKENNINTPIIAMFVYAGNLDLSSNLTVPIVFTLPYLDTFNISNPECVRLIHGTILGGRITQWMWTRSGCELREDRGNEGVCSCLVTGIFAITTDMYDDNWNKGEVRPILMNFASYIGCCASSIMCLATCLLHIYYRTSSSTCSLHKNLGISVVLGQLVFMIGIERYDHVFLCQMFAIALHYCFLANFSWLMNEAFNLYIVITYSSHAHGAHIIPAVLVGAFVGSQGANYYAKDMCWVSWDNLWLFVGPAIGIIAVTIMVLIFTAKEHNENSYTKTEKTNKFITLLMKALWTQIILITVVWSFAFISLKMSDRILKYIFGLFNCLQGSFFIVFYLLLNEEVRNIFKSKKKKKTLTAHGYEGDADDRSLDSQASTHLVEKDRLETLALDPRPRRRKDQAARCKRRQKDKAKYVADEEDERIASDCEMITSV